MNRARNGEVAVVTGASSGIGREIALVLDGIGYETVLVARRKDRLQELCTRMKNPSRMIIADLSDESECRRVFDETADDDVQILVNCAGFGVVGEFEETSLERELEMISVNVKAVHILTKMYMKIFTSHDSGYILNVASSAGLTPGGPLMSAYYATKAYVCSLTSSIAYELKMRKSNVYIGMLCPGPVQTEFNDVANVSFATKGITAKYCAEYAVMEMFNRKQTIIPGAAAKALCSAQKLVPKDFVMGAVACHQKKKMI